MAADADLDSDQRVSRSQSEQRWHDQLQLRRLAPGDAQVTACQNSTARPKWMRRRLGPGAQRENLTKRRTLTEESLVTCVYRLAMALVRRQRQRTCIIVVAPPA